MSTATNPIAARRSELLAELRQLDTAEHALIEQARRADTLNALRYERSTVEASLRAIASAPDEQPVEVLWTERLDWPTAKDHRARLTRQLGEIDNEITRLGGPEA